MGPGNKKVDWHIASPLFTVTFCLLSNRLLSGGSISIRGLLSSGALLFSGGGLFLFSRRLIPVSYTHLDVYKRQVIGSPERPSTWAFTWR